MEGAERYCFFETLGERLCLLGMTLVFALLIGLSLCVI